MNMMIRLLCTAALSGLTIAPAVGADRSPAAPMVIEGPSPVVGPTPFYLVDQGPELSGPGIMVVATRMVNTDLHQTYPFIGMSDDLSPLMVTSDYYGVVPLAPAAKIWPARVRRDYHRYVKRSKKKWHRKPVRARY